MSEASPLAPLGVTDMYTFRNGVMVSYGTGMMRFYASAESHAVVVPCNAWPVIVAVAVALGLSDEEGNLLAEAAETHGIVR